MPAIKPFFIITALLLAACGDNGATDGPTGPAEPLSQQTDVTSQPPIPACNAGAATWSDWQTRAVDYLLEPTYTKVTPPVLDRETVIARGYGLYEALRACPGQTGAAPLAPLFDFTRALHWMALTGPLDKDTHALGYPVNDRDYFYAAQPYVQFPDLVTSQPMLEAMSDPETYYKAMEMVADHNKTLPESRKWIALPYRGQFVKSPDGVTYGRFLIVVPNVPGPNGSGIMDQWVLFGMLLPEDDSRLVSYSLSMVSVWRASADATETKTHIVDFMRMEADDGSIQIIPNMMNYSDASANCYDCHKAPVLAIHPETVFDFDSAGSLQPLPEDKASAILQRINGRIPSYGPPHFPSGHGTKMDTHAYGPPLGPVGASRSDAFLDRCSAESGISSASYPAIRDAMDCAMCHNNADGGLGNLNYLAAVPSNRDSTAFQSGTNFVASYVTKGLMPPSADLTANERQAVAQCLMDEYLNPVAQSGLFRDWLLGKTVPR
ncbi:hypothetical protein [Yunchengibacter salinarum]|uniref:hypothetical protein n=1 Tax=Yunchengibacter salinarum TaxID=3133399 RepID=UPI0035B6387C